MEARFRATSSELPEIPVAAFTWQPIDDTYVLTLVAKIAYSLSPKVCALAEQQDPIVQQDATGAGYRPSDLVPSKRGADVVVVGSAYSPGGKPTSELAVRLALGSVDKRVLVIGDRYWTKNGTLGATLPFTRMPLSWDRAAGGAGTPNPVGVVSGKPLAPGQTRRLPNYMVPGVDVTGPEDLIPPAGLGPVPPDWPERKRKLKQAPGLSVGGSGSPAASFAPNPREDLLQRPLPAGFDMAYFNVAPTDQQAPEITGDEPLLLEGLTAREPLCVTRLGPAKLVPRAIVGRARQREEEIRMRCDTVWIDTDRQIIFVTWRGLCLLRSPDEQGLITVTLDVPKRPFLRPGLRSPSAPPPQTPFAAIDADTTAVLPPADADRPSAALPFAPRPAPDPLSATSVLRAVEAADFGPARLPTGTLPDIEEEASRTDTAPPPADDEDDDDGEMMLPTLRPGAGDASSPSPYVASSPDHASERVAKRSAAHEAPRSSRAALHSPDRRIPAVFEDRKRSEDASAGSAAISQWAADIVFATPGEVPRPPNIGPLAGAALRGETEEDPDDIPAPPPMLGPLAGPAPAGEQAEDADDVETTHSLRSDALGSAEPRVPAAPSADDGLLLSAPDAGFFQGRDLAGRDLSDADLRGMSLVGANLRGADLRRADLRGADLRRADLSGAKVGQARFDGACLDEVQLTGAQGEEASFVGVRGARTSFASGAFAKASFKRADLPGADFYGANLLGARLQKGRFEDASFATAVLRGAKMQKMTGSRASFTRATISQADLRRADLAGADFTHVTMRRAFADETNLENARFQGADLSRSTFRRAKLSGADLSQARLVRADLRDAELGGALMAGADLEGAKLEHAGPRDPDDA